MSFRNSARPGICIVAVCVVLVPLAALANATLDIQLGTGDIQQFVKTLPVSGPEPITLRWSTDQANATGGTWKVTKAGSLQVLASGESPAPKPGKVTFFIIPGSGAGAFLNAPAPSQAVTYDITITPHDAMNKALGSVSGVVTVVYKQQAPISFGRNANFPDIELVSYTEQIGQVQNTQIFFANATVVLRAVNNSVAKTDPFNVAVNDFNSLMRQTNSAQMIGALNPGKTSGNVTLKLTAALPPPQSQTPQEQQTREWQAEYNSSCGVDLSATIDWAGPQSKAPVNDHAEQYLYLGYGNSKAWDEGHPITTQTICDAKNCIALNDVARYVYKQLACKVVGYSLFVGDRDSGPRESFTAFGKARTALNPPAVDFSPDTTMQIASSSKVLSSLAGMRVFNGHLDDLASKNFPSNWNLPANSIVKQITLRQFLSQTSGVQQYEPNPGEDYAGLQSFFSQTLAHPNAPFFCPGSANPKAKPPVPAILPNPIISTKTQACYSNANFAIMRLVMPTFAGTKSTDPTTLANKYVQQVQQNVFAPVGVSDASCVPSGNYAKLYVYPGDQLGGDFSSALLSCGAWGWYVSVRDYAKVLVSLNSADHKILSDCQFLDMETNPVHPVGWDIATDGNGLRWLEKNGADSTGNGSIETTSVGIYLGSPGVIKPHRQCTPSSPGVAGVLFINSDISGQPGAIASTIMGRAFEAVVKPKP